ncbi:MAG: hypothetical protein ABL889_02870 [Terricaulis sp.]
MNFVPSPVTQHRLKRFVAWAMLLLVWTTQFLFTSTKARNRHIDQRWFGLDFLTQVVAAILSIRAAELRRLRRRARRHSDRFNIRAGFRRRHAPAAQARAILGARLRKQLYARDPFKRIGLLLNALRNVDAFAADIAARARNGFARRRAIMPVRPPRDSAPARLTRRVACADSS